MASFTISSLLTYFKNYPKSISRGENHYESGHVTSFKYTHRYATGKVAASMKKKEYKVTIIFTENLEIESTECECPRGASKCSHAAALYFCCKNNVSKTDMVCHWKKSRASEGCEVKSAEELYPGDNYRALQGTVTDEDRSWFYHELQKRASFTGMCWLMSPEPSMSVPDAFQH